MYETLEYIDAYFGQQLSEVERKAFEVRCAKEEEFAKEVAFYLASRSAARELLMEKKQKSWQVTEPSDAAKEPLLTATPAAPVRKMAFAKWLPYVAAACLLLVVAIYFLVQQPSAQQLAANYIKDYSTSVFSNSMDASRDSMQLGITAYKSADYTRALQLFNFIRHNNPLLGDAKKYAGLTYLQTKDYNAALVCFKELSAMQTLHINGGDILQAATLLQRNETGDKDAAKKLLQKVVTEREEGSKQAKEWLDKWK